MRFAKPDLFPICVPTIAGVAAEIQRKSRRYPDVDALLCKSDIGGAFSRIFIHPDPSKMMTTELDGAELGTCQNVTGSHLVLPFGCVASPAYFQMVGVSAQASRESYGAEDQGWSGIGNFRHSSTSTMQSGSETPTGADRQPRPKHGSRHAGES